MGRRTVVMDPEAEGPQPEDFAPTPQPAFVDDTYFKKEIRAIFGAEGPFAKLAERYEERPQQVEMADAVARALMTNTFAVIEAGTGTGKTLAYLVPAVLSGKRVVVATATKALQEQLIEKDLPLLHRMAGNFTYAVMKGRQNYLCLLRQEQFDAEPRFVSRDEANLYKKLRTWARDTKTGDRAELDLPENYTAWRDVSSTTETCIGEKCPKFNECHIVRMRQQAATANIVVVNHHLFFADLAVRARGVEGAEVIPRCEAVIFDEAHNMEDVATEFFGTQVSNWRFHDLFNDLGRAMQAHPQWPNDKLKTAMDSLSGAVEAYFSALASEAPPDYQVQRAAAKPAPAVVVAEKPEPVNLGLFDAKSTEKRESTASDSEVLARARIVEVPKGPETGRDSRWSLESSSLSKVTELHTELLGEVDTLARVFEGLSKENEDAEAEGFRRRCSDCREALQTFQNANDASLVYWAELRGRGVFLRAAPVDVAPFLRDALFAQPQAVVMTSATLATGGDTKFFRRRIGLLTDEPNPRPTKELILPAPFDYEHQAAIYVPRHLPEVTDEAFLAPAIKEIAALIALAKGRTFVLFTSLRMMNEVHRQLGPRIPYQVLLQGQKPKGAILRDFRETPSVLFATQSFWEGVDIQGDALSMVIIDKLPFASPGDPLVAARLKHIQDRNGAPFQEYQLPAAAITLKQGFGRLIRSKADTGCVAILDRRLWTKGYGAYLRNSLPPCPTFDRFADIKQWWKEVRVHEGTPAP